MSDTGLSQVAFVTPEPPNLTCTWGGTLTFLLRPFVFEISSYIVIASKTVLHSKMFWLSFWINEIVSCVYVSSHEYLKKQYRTLSLLWTSFIPPPNWLIPLRIRMLFGVKFAKNWELHNQKQTRRGSRMLMSDTKR